MPLLTEEQKKRFAPMLDRTWQAIGSDAEACFDEDDNDRVGSIIEITCDANHPEMYGGMNREDYAALVLAYHEPETKKWLREVLNY